MATIKAIEARTVHQIQSGQVIVDLCSVVKELVENGLDAGATSIEVRFKNQGLDLIEVQDNGSGISQQNYETLALKHYTSKLSTYADLAALQTFGFRGEALSSLCALSKFTVTTCLASDAPKGTRLEFETSGKLRSTSIVAAQRGTTVAIESLFYNLPVRRRELERNIKREWNKVIGVLNQYACIQTGLKFSVSQQPNKGKRIVLFSTKGNQTTRDNIVNVFGAKTLTVLIPLDLKLELEPTSAPGQRRSNRDSGEAHEVHIKGHVSRPAHGEGRQTPDRQMFFVNGRPCGLPQFAKVFNEVYKSYNATQSPFIFADIQLDTHLYDVNVSPDKRTILLHDQTRMLDNLRESLVALFESQDYAVPTSQLSSIKQTTFKKSPLSSRGTPSSENDPKRSISSETGCQGDTIPMDPHDDAEHNKEDETREPEGASARKDLVSTNSLAPIPSYHGQDVNSISREAKKKPELPAGDSVGDESEDSDRLVPKAMVRRDQGDCTEDSDHNSENDGQDSPSPLETSLEVSMEMLSQGVDVNARLTEPAKPNLEIRDRDPLPESGEDIEPPIPAISTSSCTSEIRTRTSSAALKRSAPETATITVGNRTITSIIGSPSKRQRVDGHKAREPPSRQRRIGNEVPAPSFNGRLTQMFAANSQPKQAKLADIQIATQSEDDSSDSDSSEHLFVEDDEKEEEEQEEQQPSRSDADMESIAGQEDDSVHDSVHDSPVPNDTGEQTVNDELPYSIETCDDNQPAEEQTNYNAQDDAQDDTQNDETEHTVSIPEHADTASEETQKRTRSFVKGGTKNKDATFSLLQTLRIDETTLRNMVDIHKEYMGNVSSKIDSKLVTDRLDADDAEEKLSLTISKSDFGRMKIIGQFNLGFILAVREAGGAPEDAEGNQDRDDELFIIDQHATDEKYNFERLQAKTVVQSQRLVQPKALELTALEEEVVKENLEALEANGFIVSVDESGDYPVGSRCQLLSLPLSRETTFSLADLEELVSLLTDNPASSGSVIPRPSKVRKMFAMRACRSSVMIGKPLSNKQMEKLVRHMGELDKPWNCPHGRPTMRHLCGLGAWSELGWREGDGLDGVRGPPTDWGAYVRSNDEFE
ncbi:DNA mismatch repair protein MutL [Durotheca rogersii]|uniref:DNA mismatch repair protein MutL n=1 Tax=Durotheca rogersii TaxID=419775 RepID=UPI002220B20E|nr:DNA mismatch repair protein MutL [Durotheca rogersii]KAI5868617.1 DNA mismatch repair protein MutL [Durotheca rogersii]